MPHTYSNPRLSAIISNWPLGGTHKGEAHFNIETRVGYGQRATRYTIDSKCDRHRIPKGKPSETKVLTFATMMRIVDGDDGRTYVAAWAKDYGHITIHRGDMRVDEETIFAKDPRYENLVELFYMEPTT